MVVNRAPYNVREANQWLKRVGATNFKFSTRKDSTFGKIYVLSQMLSNGAYTALCTSPGLGECVENAIVYCKIPRDW